MQTERTRLAKSVPVDEHNSCQACWLHHEHARCPGENTLGTIDCQCQARGHVDNYEWRKWR